MRRVVIVTTKALIVILFAAIVFCQVVFVPVNATSFALAAPEFAALEVPGIIMVDALEVDVTEGKTVPSYRWRLTSEGAQWCDLYRERLTALYGGSNVPASPRQVESRRIRELKASALFEQWAAGIDATPSRIQVADLLECSPASPKKVFDLRLDQNLEYARKVDDLEVITFINWIRATLEGSDGHP